MNKKAKKAFQVITNPTVDFENPHPDIFIAKTMIANASWINTSEGTVLIDTLLTPDVAQIMQKKITISGGVIKYIIYTHHHNDHLGGASVFEKDGPEIIAQRCLPDQVKKYQILKKHRARITSIQFNIPFDPDRSIKYVKPTRTFDQETVFSLGDKTFELYHAQGETEDATWIYIPELKTAFVGDLIIAGFPNIGNPFKPTRFALPWAKALERIRAKKPKMLIAHGGRPVYMDEEVDELLKVTVEAVHSVHDQVVDYINQDIPIDEMIHLVELPEHLKNNQYLNFIYSRIEFAVYNIYRWYHGYFDHNPANLLPRPQSEVNTEIFNLIGDSARIIERSEKLLNDGKAQLAIQVLDLLLKYDPDNITARKLHLKILTKLGEDDFCLMSANTWVYFMEQDRKFLEAKAAPNI